MSPLRLLATAATALALAAAPQLQAEELPTAELSPAAPTSLAARTRVEGRVAGAAVHGPALRSARYRKAVTDHFNSLTPENELKPLGRWRKDHLDYRDADEIAGFAREHGLGMRLHTLVWDHPDGLLPGMSAWSPDTCRRVLDQHVRETVTRYADLATTVDVVNEPLSERGNVLMPRWEACLGAQPFGAAFTAARQALDAAGRPDARLAVNEYGVLKPGAKADGLWRLMRDLRAQGVPVDTVGFQGHLTVDDAPSREAMVANLKRFADAGFTVEITELDVRQGHRRWPAAAFAEAQARIVADVAAACVEAAGDRCVGVTTWGVSDDWHWTVRELPGSHEAPVLLDGDGEPKAAYTGLAAALGRTRG